MKKGFIQITAIITLAIAIAGLGTYMSIIKYGQFKEDQVRKEQEIEKQKNYQEEVSTLIDNQQKVLEDTQKELAQAREEIERTKGEAQTATQRTQEKVSILEEKLKTQSDKPKDLSIQSYELAPYLTGVVRISCGYASGSGSLWRFKNGYFVFTNAHVVEDAYNNFCSVMATNVDDELEGIFAAYPSVETTLSGDKDFALLNLESYPLDKGYDVIEETFRESGRKLKTLPELNYKISSLPLCAEKESIGLSVIAVGYPAFAEQSVEFKGLSFGSQSTRATTNGIISGYDGSKIALSNSNYFVSAKIDSGNSGGIAFSKNETGLCVLGIPTWLSLGNYEAQGLVQNIHNVFNR